MKIALSRPGDGGCGRCRRCRSGRKGQTEERCLWPHAPRRGCLHEVKVLRFDPAVNGVLDFYPEAHGLEGLRGEFQGMDAEKFLPGQGPFLVTGDPFRDFDPALSHNELTLGSAPGDLHDLRFFF